MNVERTHEDGEHQSAVVEIVGLLHLLNNDNLTVGRSNDDALGILTGEAAGRAAEEVDQQQVYGGGGYGDEDKQPVQLGVGEIIGYCIDEQPDKESYSQLMGALLMEAYFSEFTHGKGYLTFCKSKLYMSMMQEKWQ